MSSRSGLVAVAVALMMASGCAGSPERGRPIPLGPVESGPNSLESVRRVFEGQWDLVSAESYDATGQPVAIKGKGRLTYDAYGNLTVDARFDEGQEQADGSIANLLSYKGRAVIDVAASRLVLQDMQKRAESGADVPDGDVGGQRPLLLVRRRSADADDQGCRRQDDREDGLAADQLRQSRGDGACIAPSRVGTWTPGSCSRCDLGPIGAIRPGV